MSGGTVARRGEAEGAEHRPAGRWGRGVFHDGLSQPWWLSAGSPAWASQGEPGAPVRRQGDRRENARSLTGCVLRAYYVPGRSSCWRQSVENRKEASGPISSPCAGEMCSPLCQVGLHHTGLKQVTGLCLQGAGQVQRPWGTQVHEPASNESALIPVPPVGRWRLRGAHRQTSAWHRRGCGGCPSTGGSGRGGRGPCAACAHRSASTARP